MIRTRTLMMVLALVVALAVMAVILAGPVKAVQRQVGVPGEGEDTMPSGMMVMGPTAIAAAGDFVYVVQGNTLYQFSARNNLALTGKTEIMQPQAGGYN